uniref:Uncharacterized protein n=1 Tax=Anguilla anguilla TaxID=7936 RepID=A0A0E9Q5X9_ANGAN
MISSNETGKGMMEAFQSNYFSAGVIKDFSQTSLFQ